MIIPKHNLMIEFKLSSRPLMSWWIGGPARKQIYFLVNMHQIFYYE